jgi:predicted nucleic acid-binding protein
VSLKICVDASLVVKLVLEEAQSDTARALWRDWLLNGRELIAPCHLAFEVFSVIRQQVHREKLTPALGRRAVDAILAQEIHLVHPQTLHERAWQLAEQFGRPTLSEAYYLAVGEHYGCDVWTADRRLYRAVQLDLPWVKLLDFYQPPTIDAPEPEH